MLLAIFCIACGLVLLVVGGELLVRGASLLAMSMHISPLVIGLTVVAFGTSAPELGVTLQAAMSGAPDVAVGNVVGSNICNVLLVLGASALVAPLVVSSQLIRLDVPLMILSALAMWLFARDLQISRLEGAILFGALLGYIAFSIMQSRKEQRAVIEEFTRELPHAGKLLSATWAQIALIVVGLALLGAGSRLLVGGAVEIARYWQVSELMIGLTIVALGTSLPEVVTSVVASCRGERDIAVGNVVGSSLFNILCVLGLTSVVSPTGVPVAANALAFDIPVMVAACAICLPIFFTGYTISRLEGGVLLFYYVAYTALLILAETHSDSGPWFAGILGYVVVPLTLVTVLGSVVWSIRTSGSGGTGRLP